MKKLLKKGWEFWGRTLIMLGAFMGSAAPVLGAGGGAADEEISWSVPPILQSVMDLMMNGFIIIGAAIVIFGAVQTAFAFRSDDAEGKAKGMRSAISGAIVVMIGAAGIAFT